MLLITGGTGSFGSAFLRNIVASNKFPLIRVYSRDWIKQKHLRESLNNPPNIQWIIGDIRDKERLKHATRNTFHCIHAAAIKCIEACEQNPTECTSINVGGTQNLIDALPSYSTNVLISTDKAVLPINIYGTSKKMAEKLWLAAGHRVCRYGNVIGSAGSVLPLYRRLIAQGATSLPVTDPRMTRFWLSMDSAIDIVKSALQTSKPGQLCIPEMPSIRIIDLCAALDMPYHVIGLRPGEKLHEWIIPPDEFNDTPGLSSGNNPYFLTVEEIRRSIDGI